MAGSADATGAPRWRLETIYPSVESDAFDAHLTELRNTIAWGRTHAADADRIGTDPDGWLRDLLKFWNRVEALGSQLMAYANAAMSVDTGDQVAIAALDRVQQTTVDGAALTVEVRNALASIPDLLERVAASDEFASYHTIFAEELLFQQKQMSAAEEALAADLGRSGTSAWERLRDVITSSISAEWGDGERKTLVELRNLAYDADRDVRRRAWELERDIVAVHEASIAAALNGVKGATHTLNSRRGWESTLERSIVQSRITPKALDALLEAMRGALPLLRRYMHTKARALGIDRLAFYDLFAPVGSSTIRYTFAEAIDFIEAQFARFSPEMGAYARDAATHGWIDAEPRAGKIGGAFCTSFPIAGESRILANFDGSYDGLSTLAHELGHGYHFHALRDLPPAQCDYPMTLAETASTFGETLVFEGARAVMPATDQLFVVEQALQGAAQIVVDILSRFTFEKRVMETRGERELSATELRDIMRAAQLETYGDGLDPEQLHDLMWAVKPHYYFDGFAFYNFPYTYGLLFAYTLYERYRDAGASAADEYRSLLRETGRMDAVALGKRFGFDVEDPAFWAGGVAVIERLVTDFEALVDG